MLMGSSATGNGGGGFRAMETFTGARRRGRTWWTITEWCRRSRGPAGIGEGGGVLAGVRRDRN